MLPFLKKRQETGLIVKTRPTDESADTAPQGDDTGIEACAQDLIEAVHARDAKRVAEAMRSAFEIMEAQPHDESSDIGDAYGEAE